PRDGREEAVDAEDRRAARRDEPREEVVGVAREGRGALLERERRALEAGGALAGERPRPRPLVRGAPRPRPGAGEDDARQGAVHELERPLEGEGEATPHLLERGGAPRDGGAGRQVELAARDEGRGGRRGAEGLLRGGARRLERREGRLALGLLGGQRAER